MSREHRPGTKRLADPHRTGSTMQLSWSPMGSKTSNRGTQRLGRFLASAAGAALAVATVAPVAADPEPAGTDTGIEFELVSVGIGGEAGSGRSFAHSLSPDGRFVGFSSVAPDLVVGDTNGVTDGFVRDLVTEITERVTVGPGGEGSLVSGGVEVSDDAAVVTFISDGAFDPDDVSPESTWYVSDRSAGTLDLVNVGSDGTIGDREALSAEPSGDGRFVLFNSPAGNLVPGDTNGVVDVFVRDLVTGVTTRETRKPLGGQVLEGGAAVGISDQGRYVTFTTRSQDLVGPTRRDGTQLFVRDRLEETTSWIDTGLRPPRFGSAKISGDARYVVFTRGDVRRGTTDFGLYHLDRETGVISVVRLPSGGDESQIFGSFEVSDNGRYVAYAIGGFTHNDPGTFYRYDVWSDTTVVIATTNPESGQAIGISADGSKVLFATTEALVPEDTNDTNDVYIATLADLAVCEGRAATITGTGAITGTEGDDVILGSSGVDVIDGLGGDDLICAGAGDDRVNAGPGQDRVFGEDGDDRLFGDSGNDVLDGGPGADDHVGGDGDDVMVQSFGDDIYRGGPGVDTVDYSTAIGPVLVRINGQAGSGRQAESDTINTSIENITGSTFDDLLVGSVGANRLDGGEGDDVIRGRAGDDSLIGGPDDDIIQGESGADLIDAGRGNDRLIGGPGPDALQAGDGTDYCRGSAGPDTYFDCETADP